MGLTRLFVAAEDENSVEDMAAFCKPENCMSEFPRAGEVAPSAAKPCPICCTERLQKEI